MNCESPTLSRTLSYMPRNPDWVLNLFMFGPSGVLNITEGCDYVIWCTAHLHSYPIESESNLGIFHIILFKLVLRKVVIHIIQAISKLSKFSNLAEVQSIQAARQNTRCLWCGERCISRNGEMKPMLLNRNRNMATIEVQFRNIEQFWNG